MCPPKSYWRIIKDGEIKRRIRCYINGVRTSYKQRRKIDLDLSKLTDIIVSRATDGDGTIMDVIGHVDNVMLIWWLDQDWCHRVVFSRAVSVRDREKSTGIFKPRSYQNLKIRLHKSKTMPVALRERLVRVDMFEDK